MHSWTKSAWTCRLRHRTRRKVSFGILHRLRSAATRVMETMRLLLSLRMRMRKEMHLGRSPFRFADEPPPCNTGARSQAVEVDSVGNLQCQRMDNVPPRRLVTSTRS